MKNVWVLVLAAACSHLGDEELMKPKAAVQTVQGQVEMATLAQAHLAGLNGSDITGLARFVVDRGVVTMDLTLANVPEGVHAIHLDENGDCAGDGSVVGPHWNPSHAPAHGRFDAPPFHLGDVGNVRADSSGQASLVFATEEWSIGTGEPNDIVGRAITIEEGKDDFLTQPDGHSGRHIACGSIQLTAAPPAVSAR
jgi:superoxide dismutase, Cu-Zn family